MSESNEPDSNEPDFHQVEYEIAIESISTLFANLRKAGLSRLDAAAIVASVMKNDGGDNG